MQKLVNIINEKAIKYKDELFYADGEFFAIYDGKIAKLSDFSGEVRQIFKLKSSTELFINTYINQNGLDIGTLIDTLDVFSSELELYGDEIPDGLDYDAFNFLYACDEYGISPYCAYKALILIMGGAPSGTYSLMDYNGEYKSILEYISEACELIDFAYTDEYDDEYWESVINNLDSYLYTGGEVF